MEIKEIIDQLTFQAHDCIYGDYQDKDLVLYPIMPIDMPKQAIKTETGFYLRFPHQQFKITVTDATHRSVKDGESKVKS